ncbi:unnamed protein product [Cylicocyclus nassatus]|uniref:Uncharacterized protein n=1 Tax=Cylicocyclus nassatus TaxID=53992 RepID=A0AA36H2T0_CYLNA|nr:unnamed protein product [Cylicocyclus nassatus]
MGHSELGLTLCVEIRAKYHKNKIRGEDVYGVALDAPPRRGRQPEIINGAIPLKSHPNDGCFNRIPYASLIATLLCFIGVILFSVMMTWGFNATVEQTRRSLRIQDWPWLDKVQVFFVVIAVLMSLFALFFLLVGFTATGATREEIYKRDRAKFGGRCACATAMAWCVLLLVCWLFIISICSVLCCSYFIFDDLCYAMPSFTENDCIDLGVFKPLIRSFSNSDMNLCGGDAQQFCALSSTARSWYVIGWVGTCFVILGLAFFLAILSANYAHVGNASRYVELRDLALETPTNDFPHYKAGDPFYRPRHPSAKNDLPQPPSEPYPRYPPYSGSTSSSRLAEKMSESLSSRKKRRCMSLELRNNRNHISQSQDTLQQLQLITQNLGAIINLIGSVSGPATASLGDILERSAATLEELKTLSISVEAETASVKENFCAIDSQLAQLDKLWASIDKAVEFVAEKKQQLTELESLCTLVERQLAERHIITRKGKYEGDEDAQNVPGGMGSDDDDGSDSDAPMEISSKPGPDIILSASPEKEMSLFEQVQERKREEEEKRQNRTQSKKRRRIKKLQAGEFLVKAKKAEFKVLTLDKGLKKSLEPAVNFKEQLLMARTSGRRERVPNAAAMRAKWI